MLDLPVPPTAWAEAWRAAFDIAKGPPLLRMVGMEDERDASRWIELLTAAEPMIGAATLSILAPAPQLVVRWPIRVATMPRNMAGEVVDKVLALSWLRDITERIVIGRDQANSDVLVHDGTAMDLLIHLKAARISIKTNLIVLSGAPPASATITAQLLAATNASGIMWMSAGDTAIGPGLERFLVTLSHNRRFDNALFEGFARAAKMPATIALTDALATLQVEHIAQEINALAERHLPRWAGPPHQEDTVGISDEPPFGGDHDDSQFRSGSSRRPLRLPVPRRSHSIA